MCGAMAPHMKKKPSDTPLKLQSVPTDGVPVEIVAPDEDDTPDAVTTETAPKETADQALLAEAEHDVELKKTRRPITVKFTEHKVMERAREAAELSFRRTEVEEEFGRVKSSFKGRLDDLDLGIAQCLKDVRDGTEQRIVDLEDRFDYTDGVVRTWHGSELISDRELTAEERQIGIKFVEKKVQKEIDDGVIPASEPDAAAAN